MSDFRAYAENRFEWQGYRIWLLERVSQAGWQMRTHDGRRIPVAEATTPDAADYFCELPYEAASALLGELSRALGAVEHPEQLRRDFEHVRSRHDKLVDNLITMFDGASLAERIRRR